MLAWPLKTNFVSAFARTFSMDSGPWVALRKGSDPCPFASEYREKLKTANFRPLGCAARAFRNQVISRTTAASGRHNRWSRSSWPRGFRSATRHRGLEPGTPVVGGVPRRGEVLRPRSVQTAVRFDDVRPVRRGDRARLCPVRHEGKEPPLVANGREPRDRRPGDGPVTRPEDAAAVGPQIAVVGLGPTR